MSNIILDYKNKKFDLNTSEVQTKGIWFVMLGLTLIFLGLLAFANLLLATEISVLYVGLCMSIGGFIQVIHSFKVKNWSGFFYLLFGGLIYTIAGLLAVIDPFLAALTLTLLLSFSLIVSGALRIWFSFDFSYEKNWGWLLLSGITTVFAGLIFAFGLPVNTLWLLGMILAFDLTFQGLYALVLGMGLRKINYI